MRTYRVSGNKLDSNSVYNLFSDVGKIARRNDEQTIVTGVTIDFFAVFSSRTHKRSRRLNKLELFFSFSLHEFKC